MTPDLDPNQGIHHPRFGEIQKEKMDDLGVECVVRFREDYPSLPVKEFGARVRSERADFVRRQLKVSCTASD
jgi:hypothetical protein